MDGAVEVVLVDDNTDDVTLTLRALQRASLLNHIEILHDGAEALEFFLGRDVSTRPPTLILARSKHLLQMHSLTSVE